MELLEYCNFSLFFSVIIYPEGIGEGVEREDCVQALSGQIFMGMVSSQFQARLDTVRLIDALVTACIRFVYFSMEDELRSKVNTQIHSSYEHFIICVSCWPQ